MPQPALTYVSLSSSALSGAGKARPRHPVAPTMPRSWKTFVLCVSGTAIWMTAILPGSRPVWIVFN
jgi:hypothetical protein